MKTYGLRSLLASFSEHLLSFSQCQGLTAINSKSSQNLNFSSIILLCSSEIQYIFGKEMETKKKKKRCVCVREG